MDINETFRQTRVPNNWCATPLIHFLEGISLNYWQRMSNFHKDIVRSMVEEKSITVGTRTEREVFFYFARVHSIEA